MALVFDVEGWQNICVLGVSYSASACRSASYSNYMSVLFLFLMVGKTSICLLVTDVTDGERFSQLILFNSHFRPGLSARLVTLLLLKHSFNLWRKYTWCVKFCNVALILAFKCFAWSSLSGVVISWIYSWVSNYCRLFQIWVTSLRASVYNYRWTNVQVFRSSWCLY